MASADYPVLDGNGAVIENGNNGGSQTSPPGPVVQTLSKAMAMGPYSATALGNLFAFNTEGYTLAAVHVKGTFVASIVLEGSNDTTNGVDGDWRAVVGVDTTNPGTAVDGTTILSPSMRIVPCAFKWLRGRVAAYTSGTIGGNVELEQGAWPAPRSVAATLLAATALIGSAALSASATVGTGTINARIKSAATTNGTLVLTGARKLMGYTLHNTTASKKYVKLYNKATAPTVGTDVPVATIEVPANGQATYFNPIGKAFSLGLCYAITGALADADTTAVAVDDVTGHIDYV